MEEENKYKGIKHPAFEKQPECQTTGRTEKENGGFSLRSKYKGMEGSPSGRKHPNNPAFEKIPISEFSQFKITD